MMKKTRKTNKTIRIAAMLSAVLLLLPTVLSGCVSADELAKRRQKTNEISKLAEEYMLEKYNRGFNVKKCEYASGDKYEGDFFITFNNGIHGFYDADEDLFYDDRQAEKLNDDVYKGVFLPMLQELNLTYDNVGTWSQVFNMKYETNRGGELKQYSMYHDYYDGGSAKYYCRSHEIEVTSQNLILISDKTNDLNEHYKTLDEWVRKYFRGQRQGDMRFYVVTSDLHGSRSFKPEQVDETMDGCLACFRFAETNSFTRHKFAKVEDGLYAMLCSDDGVMLEDGDVILTPVSNSDAVSQKILDSMNSKNMNLVDKYVTKKRSVQFENIYQVKFSEEIAKYSYDAYTLAFVMKDSDEEITEYAEMQERERSFFAYNLNGEDYNATCLCSPNSRSTKFTYNKGDEVYVWFGTQF